MSERKAYYSIIQYMPDAMRQEGKNYGVILFIPGSGALERVNSQCLCRVIPKCDCRSSYMAEYLEFFPHLVLRKNITTLDRLESFIELQRDSIQVVMPRCCKIVDHPEVELDRLYSDLVL